MPISVLLYGLTVIFALILVLVTLKGIKYTAHLFRDARDLDRASLPAIILFVGFAALALIVVWAVLIGILVLPWTI